MTKKFETINMHNENPLHRKEFDTMEEALNYFQTLGKVVVTGKSEALVDGMTKGASTQVYRRTIVSLFSPDHDFDAMIDGDCPEDVIIIQENTPIAAPLMRFGKLGL